MIFIEDIHFDSDLYCLSCNKLKGDTKKLKFTVKDNTTNGIIINICKKCRIELLKKLAEEL